MEYCKVPKKNELDLNKCIFTANGDFICKNKIDLQNNKNIEKFSNFPHNSFLHESTGINDNVINSKKVGYPMPHGGFFGAYLNE